MDDAAALLLQHMGDGPLGQQHGALHVHGIQPVHLLLAHVRQHLLGKGEPGAVHQQIDPPKMLLDSPVKPANVLFSGDIGGVKIESRFRRKLGNQGLCPLPVPVILQRQGIALPGQRLGAGTADDPGCPGDQRDLHLLIPPAFAANEYIPFSPPCKGKTHLFGWV